MFRFMKSEKKQLRDEAVFGAGLSSEHKGVEGEQGGIYSSGGGWLIGNFKDE